MKFIGKKIVFKVDKKTGKQIVSKLFGLILAVIAVQFVINGVLDSGLV